MKINTRLISNHLKFFLCPNSGTSQSCDNSYRWTFSEPLSHPTSIKHCSQTYTYRHITANTVVLNVYMFVLFSSTSIIASVTPASHLIHLTVWAPRLIVVWAYLHLYFKYIIKPQAEYKSRDYLMFVSQLQALCNVQQWDAEMARSGHILIKVLLPMGWI